MISPTRGNPDLPLDLAHTRAESDQVIIRRRQVVGPIDWRLLQGRCENPFQIPSSDRFGEMIEGSESDGLNGIGTIGKCRKHNDGNRCFAWRRESIPDMFGIFRSRNAASALLVNSNACCATFASKGS